MRSKSKAIPLLWFNSGISDETRLKLRVLASADFQPPVDDYRPITMKTKIESLEEIDRLIRQPTKMKRQPR